MYSKKVDGQATVKGPGLEARVKLYRTHLKSSDAKILDMPCFLSGCLLIFTFG